MSAIVVFGKHLAEKLGKENKSGAICGFLRIAIKEEFSPEAANHPTVEQMIKALDGLFKVKLAKLKWEGLDQAIDETILYIRKNQSVFTMSQA